MDSICSNQARRCVTTSLELRSWTKRLCWKDLRNKIGVEINDGYFLQIGKCRFLMYLLYLEFCGNRDFLVWIVLNFSSCSLWGFLFCFLKHIVCYFSGKLVLQYDSCVPFYFTEEQYHICFSDSSDISTVFYDLMNYLARSLLTEKNVLHWFLMFCYWLIQIVFLIFLSRPVVAKIFLAFDCTSLYYCSLQWFPTGCVLQEPRHMSWTVHYKE